MESKMAVIGLLIILACSTEAESGRDDKVREGASVRRARSLTNWNERNFVNPPKPWFVLNDPERFINDKLMKSKVEEPENNVIPGSDTGFENTWKQGIHGLVNLPPPIRREPRQVGVWFEPHVARLLRNPIRAYTPRQVGKA